MMLKVKYLIIYNKILQEKQQKCIDKQQQKVDKEHQIEQEQQQEDQVLVEDKVKLYYHNQKKLKLQKLI